MEFIGPKIKDEINNYLKTRVETLYFSTKVENVLVNASIRTVGGIVKKNGYSLYELDGIGVKGVEEIKMKLSESFNIEVLKNNDSNGYEYLKFTPKYYEVEDSHTFSDSKIKTDEEKITEENSKKDDINYIGPRTKEEIDDFLKTRVDSMSFSKRVENALIRESIRTVGGIARKSGSSLYGIDGIGVKGVEEIKMKLSEVFDIKINGRDFKFIPRYTDLSNEITFKELTEEEKIREFNNKKEVQEIEERYFEKQEERKFIHETKIISLGIDPRIETILLNNYIFMVGDLLSKNIENIKEKYSLNNQDVDSIKDIFSYLLSRDEKIDEEQEELRKKEIELIGRLNHRLKREQSLILNEYIKITPRNLGIFSLFRKGLTLEQIGKENNFTRERARQIIRSTLDKIGLDYEEEKLKIYTKKREAKSKKIIKEKKWGAYKYDFCTVCNTTEFSHSRNGICERCNGAFSGETREKIILSHYNRCDNCNITRSEVVEKYKHDLFITKEQKVLCRMCFLWETGKKLGDSRKNKWKMFYK